MAIFKHHDPPTDFSSHEEAVFAIVFELPLFLLGFLLSGLNLPVEFGTTEEDKKVWTDKPWEWKWT